MKEKGKGNDTPNTKGRAAIKRATGTKKSQKEAGMIERRKTENKRRE